MGVWKAVSIGGLGVALLIAAAATRGTSQLEVMVTLNAAIGMAIIALLAIIIEKMSRPK